MKLQKCFMVNKKQLKVKISKETFSENSSGINLPSIQVNKKKFESGIDILDLIILTALVKSKSEIRRLIKGKGIRINNVTILNDKIKITQKYFKDDFLKLSVGKKKHIKIELI